MALNRNTVLQALFTLLSASSAFATTGRKLQLWSDTVSQPALFQRLVGESHQPMSGYGQTQKVTMHVEVWIYAKNTGVDDPPEGVMLPLLDALDTALLANSTFDGRQTLGLPDVVVHAWREGEATYSQGDLGDQIICLVPVHIEIVGQLGS